MNDTKCNSQLKSTINQINTLHILPISQCEILQLRVTFSFSTAIQIQIKKIRNNRLFINLLKILFINQTYIQFGMSQKCGSSFRGFDSAQFVLSSVFCKSR